MTQKEYSTLMGYETECPFKEYETANFIYMMAGDMDKQTFCKEYQEVGYSPLVLELAEQANKYEKETRKMRSKEETIAHTLIKQAAQIRQGIIAKEASADSIEGTAEQMISHRECIKYKIANQLPLSEYDLQTICKLI